MNDSMTGTGIGGMRDLDYKSALSVIHVDASIVSDDRWALNPHPLYLLYSTGSPGEPGDLSLKSTL